MAPVLPIHGPPSPDWSEAIPATELAEKHLLSGIDDWLRDGHGRAYEAVISSDDRYGELLVAELISRGYEASGRRDSYACHCHEHNGEVVADSYYTIRIVRKKED